MDITKLAAEILASIKPEESKFGNFVPNFTFSGDVGFDYLGDKIELLTKGLDISKMKYEYEPSEKEDSVQEGRGEEIYVTDSPEINILISGNLKRDDVNSMFDQLFNVERDDSDKGASFKLVPKIKYQLESDNLKLNISYDIDQDSVKFDKHAEKLDPKVHQRAMEILRNTSDSTMTMLEAINKAKEEMSLEKKAIGRVDNGIQDEIYEEKYFAFESETHMLDKEFIDWLKKNNIQYKDTGVITDGNHIIKYTSPLKSRLIKLQQEFFS